jgi:beta-lactamase class A
MQKALLLSAMSLLFRHEQAGLKFQIEQTASQAHGRVGVACALPGHVLACDVNADAKFPMQSVYELPIAMAALHAIEQGRFTIDQRIRFERSDLNIARSTQPLAGHVSEWRCRS